MLAPIALIVGLALSGGGYDLSVRHIGGLAVWLVVVGLLVLGAAAGAKLGRPLYWAVGLLGGLALFSAISSLWSGSVELSVIEADRVLVYLGFFLAAFLVAQTDERRQRFAEGLAIAVTLVAFLGLGSRLLPHVLDVGNSLGTGPRMRYPLGYWNANGAIFGISIAFLLWMSRRAGAAALRWFSVAAMPVVLLALYFTYSRGGLLSLVIAAGCLLAMSRDRLWMLGTLACGAIGVLPAFLAVQSRQDLADNVASQTSVHEGVVVLLFLLGGIALALLAFAGLLRVERKGGRATGKALKLSRNPALLRGIALAGAIVGIGVAIAVGGRAWSQFTNPDVQFPDQPARHFTELNSAGRNEFWRVAIDAFEERPVGGQGAGTYQFSWDRHRSINLAAHDAHSLYLEAFAELGVIGGVLVLALVGAFLWFGFSAWRAAPFPSSDRYAVLFAAMLAFAIGAALDWFWEIAALGGVFFLAAGALVAVRCAQLAPADRNGDQREAGRGRYGLAIAGLAIAWVSAIALIGPLLVDREIKASRSAAADGNFVSAINHADTARSIEPFAASPYLQLGELAELQRDYATAKGRLTQAIHREDSNWQLYYLRSRVEHEAGDAAAALADLERARQLNPQEDCLRGRWTCE